MEYVVGTSKRLWLVRILVLRFVIPEACTYSLSLCYDVGAWFIFDYLPFEWRSRTSNGLFLPIYPPRGMRSSTLLRGIINFCNKYMSSLWLMWVHGLYTLLPFRNLLASTVLCIALSHLYSRCKLRQCIQTPYMICSITHKPPYIFIRTATIPTYYGISIAIPRYIAMQLPSSSYTWLEHSLSYCFAWS